MSFNFDVQGVFRMVVLERDGAREALLCFNTVEDGTPGGAYWVLARRESSSLRWVRLEEDGVFPRLHPKDRERILDDEPIDSLDAELVMICTEEVKL